MNLPFVFEPLHNADKHVQLRITFEESTLAITYRESKTVIE